MVRLSAYISRKSLMLISGDNAASYFNLADRVLLVKGGQVTELDINELLNKSGVESHTDDAKGDVNLHAAIAEPQQVGNKLQSQRRAQEDAADDLTRKTGDISLYGQF